MILSRLDLPAPLAPSTPIFAPWKKDSQMPRRISRFGGTTFRRSFITYAYSPAINQPGGPRTGPPSPPCSAPSAPAPPARPSTHSVEDPSSRPPPGHCTQERKGARLDKEQPRSQHGAHSIGKGDGHGLA